MKEFAENYGYNINPELKPEQRTELLQLLFDDKSSFTRNMSEMKTYPYYQRELELLSNRRVFRRNYRYSPDDARIAEEQIQAMLKNNVIEESTHTSITPLHFCWAKNLEPVDLSQILDC